MTLIGTHGKMIPETLEGGCLCGHTRYELTQPAITLYACHCGDCQKSNGSAFVLAMRFPYGCLRVIKGSASPFARSREDGRQKVIFRCPDCLSALWGESPDRKDYITVYAGTLDTASSLVPVVHIWMEDAQPWIVIPPYAQAFQQNAPDQSVFERAWKSRPNQPF